MKKIGWIALAILVLFSVFGTGCSADAQRTDEVYGRNVVYYNFSEIPEEELILDKKIKLPKDLKKYLDDKYNNPRIKHPARFEQEVWEEAAKLGYTPDNLKNLSAKEAIMATVEIVASKFTFCYVDTDQDFIAEYGSFLPHDEYFHLGKGDCDKYAASTIAVFKIIKDINPRLRNVYLSNDELGGEFCWHAWVSVLIPQENYLLLSHIDPTFYDNDGTLEAEDGFHIEIKSNIFLVKFYKQIFPLDFWRFWSIDGSRLLYACQLWKEIYLETADNKLQERILNEMSFDVLLLSIYEPKPAVDLIEWALKEYESKSFSIINLDDLLYRAYEIHLRVGDRLEAKKYKQRLLTEFPDSYWTDLLTKKKR